MVFNFGNNDFETNYLEIKPLVDLGSQTRILPDGSRVAAFLEGDQLKECCFDDARTIKQAVERGLRVSKNGPMLGYRQQHPDGNRPYVIDRSYNLVTGLRKLGAKPGQETFIGIHAKNRPEWIISELAIYNNRNVVVSLYDTLGEEARLHIINEAGIEIVFCDNEQKALSKATNYRFHLIASMYAEEKFAAFIKSISSTPSLKHLVLFEVFDDDLKQSAASHCVSVHSLNELIEMGKECDKQNFEDSKPSDLCTVCYTSGTTGKPKGVMLTHANLIACTTIFETCPLISLNSSDVFFSYLPLAHMYERLMECQMFALGIPIGYYSGDILKLNDDLKTLRPTLLPLVPRLLTRIYDKVIAELDKSLLKKTIFNLSLAYKSFELQRGIVRNDSFVDRLILKRLRDELGGRVRFMTIGSAPVLGRVLSFARAAFGALLVEGYGQTECSAACALGLEADLQTGHVGVPSICCAIKLVDVPELGYFASNNVGEICIRGYNVFKGYYKDEEKTRETLDADGWLHSGDIGEWSKNGTLKIIDRKKHIFKLQQGEYIAPEKIEAIYSNSKLVQNIFVYGESLKTCLVAIVVPDETVLRSMLGVHQIGLKNSSFQEICSHEKVKKIIFDDLIEVGKKAGLNSMELVKDIYLSSEAFTVENDLMTPTMKRKRPNLSKYFNKQLQEMYSKLV
ncbi:unnamed protein product [Anisakis simplex]|uniref:Long-chain-fatty-acid--CoA ligase n=1 Tax=Anisakis simplex TaxID=6269 RepID=A0A0M3K138_ANISI|nr:unnamed protein product [Anisakis simplex]